jgi:hypothetical protein
LKPRRVIMFYCLQLSVQTVVEVVLVLSLWEELVSCRKVIKDA